MAKFLVDLFLLSDSMMSSAIKKYLLFGRSTLRQSLRTLMLISRQTLNSACMNIITHTQQGTVTPREKNYH